MQELISRFETWMFTAIAVFWAVVFLIGVCVGILEDLANRE